MPSRLKSVVTSVSYPGGRPKMAQSSPIPSSTLGFFDCLTLRDRSRSLRSEIKVAMGQTEKQINEQRAPGRTSKHTAKLANLLSGVDLALVVCLASHPCTELLVVSVL